MQTLIKNMIITDTLPESPHGLRVIKMCAEMRNQVFYYESCVDRSTLNPLWSVDKGELCVDAYKLTCPKE